MDRDPNYLYLGTRKSILIVVIAPMLTFIMPIRLHAMPLVRLLTH